MGSLLPLGLCCPRIGRKRVTYVRVPGRVPGRVFTFQSVFPSVASSEHRSTEQGRPGRWPTHLTGDKTEAQSSCTGRRAPCSRRDAGGLGLAVSLPWWLVRRGGDIQAGKSRTRTLKYLKAPPEGAESGNPGAGLAQRLGSHRNVGGISTRCEKKNPVNTLNFPMDQLPAGRGGPHHWQGGWGRSADGLTTSWWSGLRGESILREGSRARAVRQGAVLCTPRSFQQPL